MKLLLIDQNPIIQKLVSLSAQKSSVQIEVATTMAGPFQGDEYDFLFVDDEVFDAVAFVGLKESLAFKNSVLIVGKNSVKADGFDTYLQKPFLPTELVDYFVNAKQGGMATKSEEPVDEQVLEEFASTPTAPQESDGLDEFEILQDDEISDITTDLKSDVSFDTDVGADFSELDDLDVGVDLAGTPNMDLSDIGELEVPTEELASDNLDDLLKDEVPSDLDVMDFGDLGASEPTESEADRNESVQSEVSESAELGGLDDVADLGIGSEELALDEDLDMDFGISEDGSLSDSLVSETFEGDSIETGEPDLGLELEENPLDEGVEGIGDMMPDLSAGGILNKEDINEVKEILNDELVEGLGLEDSDLGVELSELEELQELDDKITTNLDDGDEEMQDIKIENSELASLTEEALSEALGEESIGSIDEDGIESMDGMGEALDLGGIEESLDLDLDEDMDTIQAPQVLSHAIESKPNSDDSVSKLVEAIGTMNLNTLRGLLDGLQVTLNLSYPKK